ncbi:MAG: nucleotidyltransferase domain-containing protein [Oscillochloris sp.]|nr:nucleotidyltransferase domain-containing protein [Oscillochloris sp.]
MSDLTDPPLTIPAGTQVVAHAAVRDHSGTEIAPAGTVGVIVAVPDRVNGQYRVLLADSREMSLFRHQLSIRKAHQREGVLPPMPTPDSLRPFIIYRCIVGSRAFGLDDANSDTDRRGMYLPPAQLHWSLAGLPEQIDDHTAQECYWELEKFLRLALKANPNVLECLHTPLVEYTTPLADELLAMRHCFLSKHLYQTYNGYVLSQFRRMEQDLRTHGTVRHKHAMHLIRLLLSGISALREGTILIQATEHRERLLAIKRGDLPWAEVNAWRLALHQQFDAAYVVSKLPDQPDYVAVDAFLMHARRMMVEDSDA